MLMATDGHCVILSEADAPFLPDRLSVRAFAKSKNLSCAEPQSPQGFFVATTPAHAKPARAGDPGSSLLGMTGNCDVKPQ